MKTLVVCSMQPLRAKDCVFCCPKYWFTQSHKVFYVLAAAALCIAVCHSRDWPWMWNCCFVWWTCRYSSYKYAKLWTFSRFSDCAYWWPKCKGCCWACTTKVATEFKLFNSLWTQWNCVCTSRGWFIPAFLFSPLKSYGHCLLCGLVICHIFHCSKTGSLVLLTNCH